MSIPTEQITNLLNNLASGRIDNLIAQVDARRILQEVKEEVENYPNFEYRLTEKSIHIAYTLLSCGCSIIENDDIETEESLPVLEKAGKILSDIFLFTTDENINRELHLLIAGMALYASKQYSRAFIVLKDVDTGFKVGQIIISFIKKDFESLRQITREMFFSPPPGQCDLLEFDEWVISHEISRCFLIVIDYINTGNDKDFEVIDDILEKLLVISLEDNLTLYWMIIRLLRININVFKENSLWSNLLPFFTETHMLKKYIRLLSHFDSPVTEIWPSQMSCLPLALGDNRGSVINLRTSGGKTRIAEIAILKTLSNNPLTKVLYLAPFRSLAFEIEQSLNKTFQPLGVTVSQLYGGATTNVSDLELINQSQIIIATPEKAKALIRCGSGIEKEINLIVIDEGHLLGAEKRYIRNEMFLTHINEFASRNNIRVLLLSAVLPNANELAQWISYDSNNVAKSKWKPSLERTGLLVWDGTKVRLEWRSEGKPFNPNFIIKKTLGYGRRRNPFPMNKKEAIAATSVRLAQNGTVMIYSARANSIEGIAGSVLLALGNEPDDYSWEPSLWRVFESICAEELDNEDIVLKAARKGIICHSNRLPSRVRIAIERLMRSKPPLIIIASSTLGQGVNIGISTVIVSTPYYSNRAISNRDFWNICGRAGRAFSDTEGKILYVIDTTKKPWQVKKDKELAKNYFDNKQMERVESGLLICLDAIFNIARETEVDFNLLIEMIANDGINNEIPLWVNEIFDFLDDELLAMHEDFCNDDENIDWIDDVFRNSLAFIQATKEERDIYIDLLKLRTGALIKRIPNKFDRKRIIASGVPLSISQNILSNIEFFRTLANIYLQAIHGGQVGLNTIDGIIQEIEIWSLENASTILESDLDIDALNQIRRDWLEGVSLSNIKNNVNEAGKITKDYYGFTLPWILHAISQMFDIDFEEEIVGFYSDLAMFVEFGLPNKIAANIYISGVRSRNASLELAMLEEFQGKSLIEVKNILFEMSPQDSRISKKSQVWVELLSSSNYKQTFKKISFPTFTWKRGDLPDRLYIHEHSGDYFLVSGNGYFRESIESTDELPFNAIANINGLYFECENNLWKLKSHNPKIRTEESILDIFNT